MSIYDIVITNNYHKTSPEILKLMFKNCKKIYLENTSYVISMETHNYINFRIISNFQRHVSWVVNNEHLVTIKINPFLSNNHYLTS